MRRRDEQTLAALCHFFNAIPIWGMIFSGFVLFDNREKSRFLAAQARQALLFHGLFLAVIVVWMLVELVTALLNALFAPLGSLLRFLNHVIVSAALIGFVGVCVWGGLRAWAGEFFRYPFIGDRLQL